MTSDLRYMFRGIRALYGEAAFAALQQAHVMVIGTGGVGSWLAEALCRTGVGEITLLDFDVIEPHNVNRQVHTLTSTIGRLKVDVLGQRLTDINPELKLNALPVKLTPLNIDDMLSQHPAPYAAEAIDDVDAKAAVFAALHKRQVRFICSGGAGGRTDPGRIAVDDVAKIQGDALISRMRSVLRREYACPLADMREFGVMCVHSSQKPVYSDREHYLSGDMPAFGASMAVTASFGLRAAAWLIDEIIRQKL